MLITTIILRLTRVKSKLLIISLLPIALCIIDATCYANLRYNPDQLKQFESTGRCPNCDLTKTNVAYETHNNAILSNALLTESMMEGATFANSDFSQANLVDVNAYGVMFSGSNFSQAKLQNSNFSDANCSRADFAGADLSNVDFSDSNLIQAKITTEQLATVKSLSCAIMPDGTQHPASLGHTC